MPSKRRELVSLIVVIPMVAVLFTVPFSVQAVTNDVFWNLRNDTAGLNLDSDQDTGPASDTTTGDTSPDTTRSDRRSVVPPLRSGSGMSPEESLPANSPRVRIVIPRTDEILSSKQPDDTRAMETTVAENPDPRKVARSDTSGTDTVSSDVRNPNYLFVGLRWPGVSVGVRDGPYTLELKHLRESSDISITGFRLYHRLLNVSQSNLYWGLDVSRISFQGDVSDGNGHSTGVYFGFQKQFANRLSWSLDLGPYYISLRDEQTNLTVDGFEFTMTTGLNLSLW